MPASQNVSFGMFQWVVGLLLVALGAVFWYYMSDLTSDVKALRKDLGEARIEYTKAIGGIQSQIAVTNTKLENILQEMQQHQRR
jgi:hypothetical protein